MPSTNVSPKPTKSVWQQMHYAVPRGEAPLSFHRGEGKTTTIRPTNLLPRPLQPQALPAHLRLSLPPLHDTPPSRGNVLRVRRMWPSREFPHACEQGGRRGCGEVE